MDGSEIFERGLAGLPLTVLVALLSPGIQSAKTA
jgi:hypothetical protein